MSVQSLNGSSNSLYAQLLQAESSSLFGSPDSQSLPQLSNDQLQQLKQALQQDLRQAFSGQSSGSGSTPSSSNPNGATPSGSASSLQSQIDQSVSNTLGQFGFTNSQTQSVIDKLNQALSGPQGASGHAWHGHGRHRVQQTVNSLLQAFENNSSSQNSGGSNSSSDPSSSSLNGITAVPLSGAGSGQSLDLTA